MSDTGTSLWGDPDAAIARVEEQVRQAQEQAVRAQQLADDVAGVRGRAVSPRGEVRLAVEVSGRISELELTPKAYDLQPQALSQLILSTVIDAQRKAGQQALDLTAEVFGADSGVALQLRSELDKYVGPEKQEGIRYD